MLGLIVDRPRVKWLAVWLAVVSINLAGLPISPTNVAAQTLGHCSADKLGDLIRKGHSEDEITQICNAPAGMSPEASQPERQAPELTPNLT